MKTALDKTATKFRDMAATLEREIAAKRAPRLDNTPKRAKETHAARIDADHLDRVREALLLLAESREHEGLPEMLAGIKSKSQLLPMLRTRIDCSGGYYSLRDTGEFSDTSDVAVYLRAWMAGKRGPDNDKTADERARLRRIEELERDVRFTQIPGFFPTPPAVISRMLDLADLAAGQRILEPSAGKGDIAEAIRDHAGTLVRVCEINHTLQGILKAKGFDVIGEDFMLLSALVGVFDRVVMNPPFENGQDIDHVQRAYQFVAAGGRLVSVMSTGPFFRNDRKSREFREWFERVGSERHELSADSFKGAFRSTGTSTCIVVIDRE